MRYRAWTLLVLAALATSASSRTLQRQDVLTLARESPAVVAARAHASAAGLRAEAARTRPEAAAVDFAGGPRDAETLTWDAEVGVEFPFDGSARRAARHDVASARARAEAFHADALARDVASEALVAWLDLLHAQAAGDLLRERVRFARELLDAVTQREQAGDVAKIDVHAAEIDLVRAESALAAGAASAAAARTRLAATLGLDDASGLVAEGELLDIARSRDLLRQSLSLAPDAAARGPRVAAARAESEVADAEGAYLPHAVRSPPSLRVAIAREEDANILTGGVVLPLMPRARLRADSAASAREREAARATAAAAERTALAQISALAARHAADVDAAEVLERALAPAEASSELARLGYVAGKFDLATLILLRRDALDARREHLDRMLDAAVSGVSLRSALGLDDGDQP